MYYYIFEAGLDIKEREQIKQIKDYLSSLGIAGEMTTPTPSRNVEDLVELAAAKRYSTIVAVGGVTLINQVARALSAYPIVFGIIPLEKQGDLSHLIGASDWKSAADALKKRRLQSVQQGLLNDAFCFLTPATIQFGEEEIYTVDTSDFSFSATGGTVTISPGRGKAAETTSLFVEITQPVSASKKGLFSFFSKKADLPQESRFSLTSLTLTTPTPRSVIVAGSEITQTPLTCSTEKTALKLIVAKGIPGSRVDALP